jgi:hypothetical protein
MRNSGDLRNGRRSVFQIEPSTDEGQQASSISPHLWIRFRPGPGRVAEADSPVPFCNRGRLERVHSVADGRSPESCFLTLKPVDA